LPHTGYVRTFPIAMRISEMISLRNTLPERAIGAESLWQGLKKS